MVGDLDAKDVVHVHQTELHPAMGMHYGVAYKFAEDNQRVIDGPAATPGSALGAQELPGHGNVFQLALESLVGSLVVAPAYVRQEVDEVPNLPLLTDKALGLLDQVQAVGRVRAAVDHHLGGRSGRSETGHHLPAGQVGQAEVEDHHVRLDGPGQFDGATTVLGLPHHHQASPHADGLPDHYPQLVHVLYQQDPGCHGPADYSNGAFTTYILDAMAPEDGDGRGRARGRGVAGTGRGTITVVLVDDAEEVRGIVGSHLRLSGQFDVVGEGSTGAEAVRLAAKFRPALMVLDASMPDMDGLEAVPSIAEVSPGTKVVMLSGFSSEAFSQAALDRGAAAFIDKGTPIRELPARLAQVLSGPAEPAPRSGPDAQTGTAVPGDTGQEGPEQPEVVLARHLEQFRTFFDQAAIGMATLTLSGTIVRANAALCRMLAEPETALVGRRYGALAPAPQSGQLLETIAAIGAGERDVADMEHPLNRPGWWAHSTFAAVRDVDGRPLYLFAQADDFTERRRALRQLHESDQRFRLLVEGVRDYAIFMLDPQGHISSWNSGAERMKGYRADEILGRHFRVFYPAAAQASKHPEHELEIAVSEGRYEEEGWRVRKDGSQFWANVTITAIFDQEGNLIGFGKVTRDVSERRVADLRLREAAEQTAQFVAITAHELRSPVAALTGGADLLRNYWDALDEDGRQTTLESMANAGQRLKRLVDDLLLAARLETGSFDFTTDDMPIAEAIDEAVAELPPEQGAVVKVKGAGQLLARADRARFVQIMTNLLSNAARHGAPPVTVEVRAEGAHVVTRVSDSGTGIPDDFAPHLFQKFSQAPGSSRRGTGLGLFIVRELARGQGGDAWYEQGSGSDGSTAAFAFSLPAGRSSDDP